MIGINYDELLKLRLKNLVTEKKDYLANIKSKYISDRAFSFVSFNDSSGLNLRKYYDDILREKGEIWVRQEFKKVKYVEIADTNIDETLISTLSLMFSNLSVLEIRNCNLEKNCYLSKLTPKDIIISDSIIEDFTSFNLYKGNLHFTRCNINDVGNSNIFSEKITFHRTNIDFYRLFLMSSFPNLSYLNVESEVYYDGITNKTKNLKNSFYYLPYSCPNITKLRIEGLVDDLDFLVKLTKLTRVSMVSTYGNMDSETLVINNKEKLKQLEVRNNEQVEIRKILHGVTSKLDNVKYITRSEIDRILSLNDFYRTLSYTVQEKSVLLNKSNFATNYLNFVLSKDYNNLKGYYQNDYDKLIYMENEGNLLQYYNLVYKYGCIYYDEAKEKIVIPEKAMLYIDGTPIVLKKCRKRVLTVEDAKKVGTDFFSSSESFDDVKCYVECMRDLANITENDILIHDFADTISETYGMNLGVIYKSVLDRVLGDKGPIYKLHKVDEWSNYHNHIRKLYEKINYLLARLVYDSFDLFTHEELLVLIKTLPYSREVEKYNLLKNIDDVKLSDNLISSIDAKCNFKYLRLLNSINILKQIDDNLLVKMDNCMLTERDLAKMREYMVKDANMNYENKFIIADSCDTIDLPEVVDYDFDGDKVLKL